MATRGTRNNNPLNIRHAGSQWVGMRKVQTDKCFVQFVSRKYGYRAAFVLLHNYIRKGKDTIGKIVAKWAPSSDRNNTQAYINYVSSTTGIDASHAPPMGGQGRTRGYRSQHGTHGERNHRRCFAHC